MSDSKQGTVKWFNNAKGYGFITPSEGGQDLFVHMSNIVMEGYKTLAENQEVDYKVDQVKGDEVTLSTNKVSNKSPQKITVTKKDLNPVIANTQRRH